MFTPGTEVCELIDIDGTVVQESSPTDDSQTFKKTIPRLIDDARAGLTLTSHHNVITPELWSVFDVSQFLRINDCAAYCESFSKKVNDMYDGVPL